jgi:YHS domain-containing protein
LAAGVAIFQKKVEYFELGNDIIQRIKRTMKNLKPILLAVFLAGAGAMAPSAFGADKDAKLKPYPLQTCVVSGEKLEEMGKPYTYEYKDREIKFCCKDCAKDFKKEPAKYVKKLEAAEAKEKK